jgi:hypothetical protein
MKTTLIILGLTIVIWVISHLYRDWNKEKKSRELRYQVMYLNIKQLLNIYVVNEKSYCLLLRHFLQLRKLKYKNEETTSVLENEFYRKYKKITNKILEGDENLIRGIKEVYKSELFN